jgi:hypothetical protein
MSSRVPLKPGLMRSPMNRRPWIDMLSLRGSSVYLESSYVLPVSRKALKFSGSTA